MSESVVKLKIDSKEYEANIKRIGNVLTEYYNKVKAGGGTLMVLDEGILEAAKAMGELETKSVNAKGALRELTQATMDMTASYRSLTDEEKASPLGQAMQKSIAQMTERAGQMRDAMADVQASITRSASDTRAFDQIAGGMTLMTSGYQTMAGAAKLFGVETEDNVEVLATLQSAMAVTSGLQSIQNALQSQSAVMMGIQSVQTAAAAAAQTSFAGATGIATAAQAAFNAVANANPYVLLASAVVAVGTALYAFSKASSNAKKENEEYQKSVEESKRRTDEARNSYISATAEMVNTTSRIMSLRAAYINANDEISKTRILKDAQQEFHKLGIECNSLNEVQRTLVQNGDKVIEMLTLQANAAALSAIRMEAFKKSFEAILSNKIAEKGGTSNLDDNDILYATALASANKLVTTIDERLSSINGKVQTLKSGLGISSGSIGTSSRSVTNETVVDKQAENTKKINTLTNEFVTASETRRNAIIDEIAALQQENAEIQKLKDIAQGKGGTKLGEASVTTSSYFRTRAKFANDDSLSSKDIQDYVSGLKTALDNEQLGSELYTKIAGELKNATAFADAFELAIKSGLEGSDLTSISTILQEKLLGEGIDENSIQSFLDSINQYIEDADLKLVIDVDTKQIVNAINLQEKKSKEMAKEWSAAGSAIQSVGSALQQIEDPAAKVMGIIGQAVATIALGFAQAAAQDSKLGVWGWIAAVAGGLGTMVSTISAIKSATSGFAEGGIIPGNYYSGDQLRTSDYGIQSGELVLSRAQQGNLAAQLTDRGATAGMTGVPYVTGETIVLGANNHLRRSGQGEIVTTSMLRRYGLI